MLPVTQRLGAPLVLTVLALAGCSDSESGAKPTTSTSTTTATIPGPNTPSPSARSSNLEDRAAADAKSAYLQYRQTVDRVLKNGGLDAQQEFGAVATGEQLDFLIRDAQRLRSNRWRQLGDSTVKSIRVKGVSLASGKLPQVLLTGCVDLSLARVVDGSGKAIRRQLSYAGLRQTATLTQAERRRWLVSQEQDTPVKSC